MTASEHVVGLPAFEMLSSVGLKVLALAFVVRVTIDAAAVLRGGGADWVSTIGKTAFTAILLANISYIGAWIEGVSAAMQAAFFDEAYFDSFASAYGATMDSLDCGSSSITGLMTGNIYSFLIWGVTGLVTMAMFVLKLLVIDVAYPIVFGLVLIGGSISVPLGLFPGMDTTVGWIKNVLEVALWPVVFSILTSLILSMFGSTLNDIVANAGQFGCESFANAAEAAGEPNGMGQDVVTGSFLFIKWITLCLAYCICVVMTPRLASLLMRSEAVSNAGSVIAARFSGSANRSTTSATNRVGAGFSKR